MKNKTYSILILLVSIAILIIISFSENKTQQILKDTGIRVEGQLHSSRKSVNSGRSVFKPMFKYQSTYVFTAIDGDNYGVIHTTSDKNTITDSKVIYYNPYNLSEYTFEDSKPFSWVREILMIGTKALVFVLLLVFISGLKEKKY